MFNFTLQKSGIRRYIGPKRIASLLVFAVVIFLVRDYYNTGTFNLKFIEHYKKENPFESVILFISIYIILVIVSMPTLPLNLAAGFFWGGMIGGVYTAVSVTLGGWLSFAIVRCFVGQPLAQKYEKKWIDKVQDEFDQKGWKFVAFARLNPIIPTGPLNYLLGLTSLSNKTFLWTTFVFLLPPAVAVAYIGDSFQTFTQHENIDTIMNGVLVISAAVTILGGIKFTTGFISKNEFSE